MNKIDLISEINRIKKEKNAVILAHNYQIGEIQDIADFVGDSLQLAKKAKDIKQDLIIFCGVTFMAESAKILNPNKKVILPVLDAGCPMADMATAEKINVFKKENPNLKVVTYVNSSAEVKAVSDVCCTSSNAVDVVEKLGAEKILFAPDKNLGTYVDEQVEGVEVLKWKGFCPIHERVTVEDIDRARSEHPGMEILVHPECPVEVFHKADFVGSTAQILEYVKNSELKGFIIGTEMGILHTLKKENPNKEMFILTEKLICENMKKTTLEDVYKALRDEENEIVIEGHIAIKANEALERMLNL
ncbi:MAG: quinolinate synthase NadA [Clostridiales bacterium]|nr:quinolinate synthase NadA [Clostridiales bacterium]